MAQLLYQVDLRGPLSLLRSAHHWCRSQWPNTHQATWCGQINVGRGDAGEGRWWFQREEDALMFRLARCCDAA